MACSADGRSLEEVFRDLCDVEERRASPERETPGLAVASDAVLQIPNPARIYDEFLAQEDLLDIEKDLWPEHAVRLLFLAVDDLPSVVLQKCVVRLSRTDSEKGVVDSFTQWAHRSSSDGTSSWKGQFLEGLALIGRNDILDVLGLDEREMAILREHPVHLSSLKVAVNTICCELQEQETADLVRLVSDAHLASRPAPQFPLGRLVTPALELHILHWMQEGVMRWDDLSVLASGLERIGRGDLGALLLSSDRRHQTPPAERSACEQQEQQHTEVTSLQRSPGPPTSSFTYPNGHGVCVVFNQETFQCQNAECHLGKAGSHGARQGSSKDAESLEKLFENFGCRTKTFHNSTGMNIRRKLREISTANDLEKNDFLVVCFLSHGDMLDGHQVIYSSDCQPLLLDDLVHYFESDVCPAMSRKLKMVITQACQGQNCRDAVMSDSPSEAPLPPRATAQSDFLFCQATTPGFKAYRDPTRGSFYIQQLCHVLRERGHLEEVTLCIKDVHGLLNSSSVPVGRERRRCDIQPQMIDRTQGRFRFRKVEAPSEPRSLYLSVQNV